MISNKIRRARQNKDLSQENMADELGITKGAYSKIERGITTISVDRLVSIAKILNLDIKEFFDEQQFREEKFEEDTIGVGVVTKRDIQEMKRLLIQYGEELNLLKAKVQDLQGKAKPKKS